MVKIILNKIYFLLFQTSSEYKSTKSDVVKKAVAYGITVQPYIVIIGFNQIHNPDCYVVIENSEFKVETPLKALDVCFKAFLL